MNITQILSQELSATAVQINTAIKLLDNGATVPFIARYRKEATGGLDDTQLRQLAERLQYLRELEERKAVVLKSIEEQGKLSDDLRAQIEAADNKTALEDLYLPYKPKRRTKAQIAREHGLQPLADVLLAEQPQDVEAAAQGYLNENVPDTKAALDGARAILMEQFAEDAELIGTLRDKLWNEAEIHAQVVEGKETEGEKFSDYFDHREPVRAMPSHRALAVLRGRNEGVLNIALKYQPDDTPITQQSEYEQIIARRFKVSDGHKWLRDTVRLTWRAKIFLSLELEIFSKLKELADVNAITVFSKNLKDLLLTAPAGRVSILGLDPGFRTGVKAALIDETGKLIDTFIFYLFNDKKSIRQLVTFIRKYKVQVIAIGNGTASRETNMLVGAVITRLTTRNIRNIAIDKNMQLSDIEWAVGEDYINYPIHKIVVSEAGASIYSASELAAREFPDLDVSLRGAVSIARRLQDPLAELVKIDPKSIGVGQYQHDVNQSQLAKSLDAVVEDCVNAVGVDVNTASAPLLARISGLNQTLAQNIVAYRDENGAFDSRKKLLKVPRLGEKTFEQAAGFLRINGGKEPLDASAVHPEAYPVVAKMLAQQGITAAELIGNRERVKQIKASDFIDERFGLPTILDILSELEKPGRDPRGEFQTASFAEGIHEISDLQVGMILEGVVSNVANFGAFVDIGVHQDGLVHISALSNKFVQDPREVVKAGDVVKVKVVEVDAARKRIALTMRLDDEPGSTAKGNRPSENRHQERRDRKPQRNDRAPTNSAMADAFAKLKR
ncbi:Tex family protein [Neisseria cinerea]|uniref:Tex family protein n=2 Tax=Neisseria TaxID=482 RepID=UPI00288A37BB|nr:Tex family protein [Neisseria cinerea]